MDPIKPRHRPQRQSRTFCEELKLYTFFYDNHDDTLHLWHDTFATDRYQKDLAVREAVAVAARVSAKWVKAIGPILQLHR